MKHRNFTLKTLWLCFSLLLVLSCYPDRVQYVDELDVVYTNYSEEFDFSQANTYSLPDQVIEITDSDFNDTNGIPEFIDPVYATIILNSIKDNMDALGWTEVPKERNPDVILLVSAMNTTTLYYYYDWGYWNWWGYPGYGPGWGWWYPGYFPPVISGYRSGTVLIQMTYPAGIGVNENIPVVWTAAINGLLEGSTQSISDRLRNTIDQSFIQSLYLEK